MGWDGLLTSLLEIKMRRERWGKERRSWKWPVSAENVQSCSRPGGTNMAATSGVVLLGEGESRTAMRRREVRRRWLQLGRAGRKSGLGKVKVM